MGKHFSVEKIKIFATVARKKSLLVFRHLKFWQKAGLCLSIILLVGLAGWQLRSTLRPESESQYYRTRLERVNENLNAIQNDLSSAETLTDQTQLPKYLDDLTDITRNCSEIVKSAPSSSAAVHATAMDSAKLCDDLMAVSSYQNTLYYQLEVFINYQTPLLEQVGDQNFRTRLETFSSLLFALQNNLNKINNNRVNDPGLDEIRVLLADLSNRTNAIKQDIEATKADPSELNRVVKRTREVQPDLMIRRGYFWNNTVGIGSLQQVIDKQLHQYP